MWWSFVLVLPLIISVSTIKVPVDYNEEDPTQTTPTRATDESESIPIYYAPVEGNIDSYLVPPDPHKPIEALPDDAVTPAPYLLPPAQENVETYYIPVAPSAQTDWYPIVEGERPREKLEEIPILLNVNHSDIYDVISNLRTGKGASQIGLPVPAAELLPPTEDAPNDYALLTPEELELPIEKVEEQRAFPEANLRGNINKPKVSQYVPTDAYLDPVEPTLSLHLTPPKLQFATYKKPTKLFPKKYAAGFKPIPIPIAQFAEDSLYRNPIAKPVKLLKPAQNSEVDYLTPSDEKRIYLYEQAEQKRKQKEENDAIQEQQVNVPEDVPPTEQDASESHDRHPGRNVYPAPLRQPPPAAPITDSHAPPPNGERTEFRMHGMKGPHSYQFGYDTGKGKNRQFRYEERDNDGHVRGHYGYMDKHGKLRVVNYDAHPELGFHAEAPVEKE